MTHRNLIRRATLLLTLVVTSLVALGGCTRISPGHVGIVVDLAGKERGVQDYTIRTGWVFYSPIGTQIFEYPTNVQTVQWTKNPNEGNPVDESITFTTKEAVSVNADVSLSYQLDGAKVPSFYVKFRSDDLNTFTYGFLHNVARDAFNEIGGQYTVEQVMGDNAGYLHAVEARVNEQVAPLGVIIQQFGFIGAPRPPENVITAINNAQQAKYLAQQKQNELAQTQAEAAKAVAAATGQAESNKVLANSITPQLLEWQRIQLQWQQLAVTDRWIAHWDGKLSQVSTGGNSPGMFLPQNLLDNEKK